MNTLKRRMFKDGNEVNTSLSPAILTYVEKLNIDPEGKTAAELQAEIKLTLEGQDAENAPGLFRTYAFDYKDPLDYVAAGLTATGIAAGAGIYLKTANTARKVKKIKDAARRAAKALNPVVRKGGINVPGQIGFQARNRFDPRSYIYKPTQTAIYGTGLGVGAKMMGDDSISTSLMPDNITSELAKLVENEKTEQQRKLNLNKKTDAEKAAKEKAKVEQDEINNYLKVLKNKEGIFDDAEKQRVSEERRYNANALMQEIGSAMAQTGSIDDGLALGATAAAKRISEEKLAERLAEGELIKKMAEKNELKDSDWDKITTRYKESARSLGKQKNLNRILSQMEASITTGSVSGARGFVSRLIDDIAGVTGVGDNIVGVATKAVSDGKYIEAQIIQDILQESGRTISDRDRALIAKLMANLENIFTGKGEALDSLSKVRLSINDSMIANRADLDSINFRYRDRIPELKYYDEIYSGNSNQQESLDPDDAVISADEIEV